MRRVIAVLIVTVALGLGLVTPAQAGDWRTELPRMPSYRVCVEDHTSSTARYRVPYSVADWNTTDLAIIYVRAFGTTNRCPATYVNNGWVVRVYEGGGSWVPGYQTNHAKWREVRLSRWYFSWMDLNDRQHTTSHELGHAWGLGHNYIWSIMIDSWPAPLSTQRVDRAAINARY